MLEMAGFYLPRLLDDANHFNNIPVCTFVQGSVKGFCAVLVWVWLQFFISLFLLVSAAMKCLPLFDQFWCYVVADCTCSFWAVCLALGLNFIMDCLYGYVRTLRGVNLV